MSQRGGRITDKRNSTFQFDNVRVLTNTLNAFVEGMISGSHLAITWEPSKRKFVSIVVLNGIATEVCWGYTLLVDGNMPKLNTYCVYVDRLIAELERLSGIKKFKLILGNKGEPHIISVRQGVSYKSKIPNMVGSEISARMTLNVEENDERCQICVSPKEFEHAMSLVQPKSSTNIISIITLSTNGEATANLADSVESPTNGICLTMSSSDITVNVPIKKHKDYTTNSEVSISLSLRKWLRMLSIVKKLECSYFTMTYNKKGLIMEINLDLVGKKGVSLSQVHYFQKTIMDCFKGEPSTADGNYMRAFFPSDSGFIQ